MEERRSVVLVVLDGLRADHVGCYGHERTTTPFLDRLAADGVRFTDAFSSAAAALPAHASILTGAFVSAHGATEESGALGAALPLLPMPFKAAGYRTAAFCANADVAPETGFGRGFDRFHGRRGNGRLAGAADYARRASDRVLGRRDAGARRINQALCEWAADAPGPFFAYVTYDEVTRPDRTPAPYDRLFASGPAADDRGVAYDGAVRYADRRLQELAEGLDAIDRWERTLVIVTATHGTPLPGDGGGVFADATLRVPLLMRCPACIPRGFVIDAFAQPIDLAPTALALAGLPASIGFGRALLGEAGATPGPDAILAEAFRSAANGSGSCGVRRKALRTRRDKFVWQSDEANALFDLVRDPGECDNVVAADTARADRLRRRLFDWLAGSERWAEAQGAGDAQVTDVARERQGARE